MQSLGGLLDDAALKAKKHKKFDLSIMNDVLQEVESARWPGQLHALKVVGSEGNRVLTIGCDSATALLISHDLSGIMERINPLLGALSIVHIKIQHHSS